jgi:hypothetical protein
MFGDMAGGLGQLGGAIAVLSGAAGDGGEDEYVKAVQAWKQLQTPGFDYRSLSPAQLRLVAEYFPQTYEAVVPPEARLAEDDVGMRDAQSRQVAGLEEVAREGMPLVDRLRATDMQERLAGEASATDQAVRSNLAARGRLGGGTEAVMRSVAGQRSANMARGMGSDLAQAAVARRYQAMLDAGQMAGQARGQSIGLSSRNADAVNRYNEVVSQLRTMAERDAAASRERAQAANTGERQRIADANEVNRYATERDDLNRQNNLRQQNFQNDVTKTSGLAGAYMGLGGARYAEQAGRENAIMQVGQGAGRAIGGAADIATGAGAFGGGMQDFYGQMYGYKPRDPYGSYGAYGSYAF